MNPFRDHSGKFAPEQRSIMEKFLQNIKCDKECIVWDGTKVKGGYGIFSVGNGKQELAHRFSYRNFVGEIADGLTIDHTCKNTSCVNPDHLEAVTMRENTLRGDALSAINARKTHCHRGHPFDRKRGRRRICLECERQRGERYRNKKKGK